MCERIPEPAGDSIRAIASRVGSGGTSSLHCVAWPWARGATSVSVVDTVVGE
jgi:hypothetical protein